MIKSHWLKPAFSQTDNGERLAFRFYTDQSASLPFTSFDTLRCISNIAGYSHQYWNMLVAVAMKLLGLPTSNGMFCCSIDVSRG